MGKEKLDREKEKEKGKCEVEGRKKISGKMNGERKIGRGKRKRKRKR